MTKPEPVDLDAITPLEEGTLYLLVPGTTNKRAGWEVTFAGPSHPQTVAQAQETSRKFLDEAARIQQSQINNKKYKVEEKTPDQSRRDFVEGIVARVLRWSPVKFGGVTYEFDPAKRDDAVKLLLQPKLGGYIAQMSDYLREEKSFMPASALN